MKLPLAAALVSMAVLFTPHAIANQHKENIDSQHLRLLPSPCAKKSSHTYFTTHCEAQRLFVSIKLKDCEIERDGLLVRDEARGILVCVKANSPASKTNLEF